MPAAARQAIAVFGGTFDPVHLGHLEAADQARRQLAIDDFRMIPARVPPHREGTAASPGHRLALLERALADYPGLRIDRRELDRPGPSFMVETLLSLRAENPEAALVLVIGQDSANGLDGWHRWREIPELAHLAIVRRAGEEAEYSAALAQELQGRWVHPPATLRAACAGLATRLAVDAPDISSSRLRRQLAAGEPVDRWLPAAVSEYIHEHGLYR